MLKDIEKAIQKSDIGINPSNDGNVIRLIFPGAHRRKKERAYQAGEKIGENAKIAIRNVRRDAIDDFKHRKRTAR
jgi:ribosome recycling factor